MTHFARAIARPPGATFASGLTTGALGAPDLGLALAQHDRYCDALRAAGVELTLLEPDDALPDSTFVEDTAVVSGSRAIVTTPGAPSRRDETRAVRDALSEFFDVIETIEEHGTVDGGDVCEADGRAFVGLSHRTNRSGAEQLAAWFERDGTACTIVDIRDLDTILHLKSAMAYVGDGAFVAIDELAPRLEIPEACIVRPHPEEAYAANCVRVNGVVLMPSGYPRLREALTVRGLAVDVLDVSEYRKMDGGLSCLSIRF